MILFTIFVFGAVVLGTGTMLAPAWPTAQPRIALMSTFALAIIAGGAVFLTALFGWQTLLVDYLLFALVVGIFLGGTLVLGQKRAEARGETLSDEDQGWPGPQDLALLGLAALVFIVLAVVISGGASSEDSTAYSQQIDALREGSTFNSESQSLYPPAYIALTAYLSHQLGQPTALIQASVGAVLALLNLWLAYDFGSEIRDKRFGRTLAVVGFLIGIGLYLAQAYAVLMGLAFVQAGLIHTLRYLRQGWLVDAVAAGLMFGAAAISSVVMLGAAVAAYALLIVLHRPQTRAIAAPTLPVLVLGIPAVSLLAIAPWLLDLLV